MGRIKRFTARVRGALYRFLFSIKAGSGLRIGKDCLLSRHSLVFGSDVVIGDYGQVTGVVELADHVYVHRHVILRAFDGSISIGRGTTVNPFCRIYGKGGVEIGELVSIAPGVTVVAANKNIDDVEVPIKRQGVVARGVRIENNVWIGANATILDGVTLGEGSVVGAGAVVTKDVAPLNVVGGVPAKVLAVRGVHSVEDLRVEAK